MKHLNESIKDKIKGIWDKHDDGTYVSEYFDWEANNLSDKICSSCFTVSLRITKAYYSDDMDREFQYNDCKCNTKAVIFND